MGLGGISVWQLVIILIVSLLTVIAVMSRRAESEEGDTDGAEDETSHEERVP